MQKSLEYNTPLVKRLGIGVGDALVVIIIATSILNLMNPEKKPFIPYAPYLILGLQLTLPLFVNISPISLINSKSFNHFFLCLSFFVVLFIFSLVSGFWSEELFLVLKRSLLVFVPIILVGLLVWSDPRPYQTFSKVSCWIVGLMSALSLLSLALFIFGDESWIGEQHIQSFSFGPLVLSQAVYGHDPFLRVSSLLGNPNALAMWLLLSLPLTAYLLQVNKLKPIWAWLAVGIQFSTLILTFSRAGLVATFISLVVYLFGSTLRVSQRIKRLSILFFIATGFFTYAVYGPLDIANSKRFSTDTNEREQAWVLLIESIEKYPLTGVGFGVSNEVILAQSGVDFNAHNTHLQIFSEIGLFGYFILLMIWFLALWSGLRAIRKSRNLETRSRLSVVIAILIAIFLHQFFEASILKPGFISIFWVYLLFLIAHPYFCKSFIFRTFA